MCSVAKQMAVYPCRGGTGSVVEWYVHILLHDLPANNAAENESRILRWTRCIIEEAYSSIDTDDFEAPPDLEPASLGLAVLKLWARLFGTNTQWPFINVLGQSLEEYISMI